LPCWAQAALEFLAGYLIEEALSVDNLFVFLLIFSYFKVPPKYLHRVLYWGVLGALVMRVLMIAKPGNLNVPLAFYCVPNNELFRGICERLQ
jgi:predicted tellurium resistance membrane protein TerC